MPMSIRNVDRHGLDNLKQDFAKPLDKLKIPPILLYIVVFLGVSVIITQFMEKDEMRLQNLQQKNLLLAMKKTL